jgi:hypothetical protein
MRGLVKVVALFALLAAVFGAGWILASSGVGRAVDPASLTDLEREFAERMRNVVLENPERYEIERVTKVDDTRWRFETRITYASVDATLPVTVPIVWAGDTPMVSITDFTIPTLGTFTARVMFYADRYAGSWQHGEFGGLMYGTIQPQGR